MGFWSRTQSLSIRVHVEPIHLMLCCIFLGRTSECLEVLLEVLEGDWVCSSIEEELRPGWPCECRLEDVVGSVIVEDCVAELRYDFEVLQEVLSPTTILLSL